MVNGIFAADLALYLVLFPLAVYNFWTHRWVGCLAWYYMGTFCALRIVAGALGVSHDDSIVANIFIGIGTSPLVLTIDGLVHEGYARSYQRIQTPTNMAFSKVECTKARPLHAPR
jgi:tellurite resistance protein TehA-like permease